MDKTLTVGQLTNYIKGLIEDDFVLSRVTVKGELSNFIAHRSGHWYFTLKDEESQIKGVMFRGANAGVTFKPKDGDKVELTGRISVYEERGEYQIYAAQMRKSGVGDLYAAFEELKQRLGAEGLFDKRYKKPLPEFPQKIGVITSANGAAIRDIKNISERRCPAVQLVLYPALVQGASAEPSLIKALEFFENEYPVDAIIIGRGGGSIEDLWGFNGEKLARTIFAMKTPVVSAVGHETDFTICDFVADLRAPTPSAAAELTIPDWTGIAQELDRRYDRLTELVFGEIQDGGERLKQLVERLALRGRERLRLEQERFQGRVGKIESLSPLAVLSRGYAVAQANGKTIKSVNEAEVGERVELTLADGKLTTEILKKEGK
jgi:exodeoxyribonuclease VII large subunit